MAKCAKCSKLVTKKSPGLQCSKCSKWIHAQCALITTDQLNALNITDSVDWKCRSCAGSGRPKRLSCIMPDADEEDGTDTELQQQGVNSGEINKQLLGEIRREIREAIRMELQQSLSFFSDKIDEYEEKIGKYEQDIRLVEKQNYELKNTCKNLDLRNDVLEQRLNSLEQTLINNNVEICGIKEDINEDLQEIVKSLCAKIGQKPEDVAKIYRKKSKQQKTNNQAIRPPAITVVLREGCREQWLSKAKASSISCRDVGAAGDGRVFLREALTPATAYLLWNAKAELKEKHHFKFVWIKNGTIIARKEENEKFHVIRSLNDITRITKNN